MQCDGREVRPEGDTLPGEAIATYLEKSAWEVHELAKVGGANTVIPCRRSGSRTRADERHLSGLEGLKNRLRNGGGRVGAGDRERPQHGTQQRRGPRPDHNCAASSSAI